MARPSKVFTVDQADSIYRHISGQVEDFDFRKNIVAGEASDSRPARTLQYETFYAARDSFKTIADAWHTTGADDKPGLIKVWLDTYISPVGWARIQAAIRQSRQGRRGRRKDGGDIVTKINSASSYWYSELAAAAGLTKKDYMSQLADWLSLHDDGKRAAASFATSRKK